MPNKFVLSAEKFIAIACWDKKLCWEKLKKLAKIMCPHALFSQAQSQFTWMSIPTEHLRIIWCSYNGMEGLKM